MGEAVTLALITSLAGLISGMVLKAFDLVAKRTDKKSDLEATFRKEIADDRERLKAENAKLHEDVEDERTQKEQWRSKYWALFRRFDFLRLTYARTNPEYGPSKLGMAPHEEDY